MARRRAAAPPTVAIAPHHLNATDATLWDIERVPSLRTTIVAAMSLDGIVTTDRVMHDLEAASRTIVRIRERVVPRPAGVGTPSWVVDDGFDLSRHVRVIDTGGDVDIAAIATVAEPMASEPFDRALPLWQVAYVRGTGDRSALVVKVHHSLTDGVGGMRLLDALLDTEPDASPRDLASLPVPVRADHQVDRQADVSRTAQRAGAAAGGLASAAMRAGAHPRRSLDSATAGTRSAARLLAPSTAPLSPLLLGRSGDRCATGFDVDLARLHAAAARHGCTVNHAFFAAAIGGLAAYHRTLGRPAERLRVTMPVSLRRDGDESGGNQWAPVRFVVPTDLDDPIERMLAIRDRVLSTRRERALGFSQSLAGLVQVLPSALSSAVVGGMMRGVDLTLTNVPGLTRPHYFGGAAVTHIHAFAPTAGAALNIALVSHLDTACIGVLSDAVAVSDPALLAELIATGFAELMSAAERREPAPAREPTPARPPTRPRRAPDRLSALDTGFLRLETDETPMHIGAAFALDGTPLRDADGRLRVDDVRRHVESRLARLPRFFRRVDEVPFGLGRPTWVDDEHFDIGRHVRVTAAASPGGPQQLLDTCAELFRSPLDRAHPLWELWLVDGLADGQVGIVEKVHHALIDGVTGVELAATLFDLEPSPAPERPASRPIEPAPSPLARVADAVSEQLADPVRLGQSALEALATPGRVAGQLGRLAGAAGELARSASGGRHRAPFNRRVGRERVLRAVTVDRAILDRTRRRLDATVNDLVLACVCGALREWFDAEQVATADVHVLVPVSTRRGPMSDEPGNHVGGSLVALPVGEPDRRRRLAAVQRRMHDAKAAHEGESVAAVFDAIDHLPPIGYGPITRLVAAQPFVDLVVTNVPGPRQPLWFLGSRITRMVPVVPLGPQLGLGIAVLSYADALTVSMFADPDVSADIDVLADAVAAEFGAYDRLRRPRPTATTP